MKTRVLVSIVLLPIFFAALFIFPPYILTIIISLICAIAAYELMLATNNGGKKRILVYTIIAAAFVPASVYLSSLTMLTQSVSAAEESATINIPQNPMATLTFFTLIFTIFFIFASLLIIEAALTFRTEKQVKLRQILISLAAGIVIPYLLSTLVSLKIMAFGHLLVLLPIISAFVTDSGAYFTGVAIGKRKAFPNISPNKTVEGYVGGLIIGTAAMLLYGLILANTTSLNIIYPLLIVYGVVGALVTALGDLFFSLIKRKCGIKDYGRLIPGHGGMLDRFDSMIFCGPSMYFLVILIPAIR